MERNLKNNTDYGYIEPNEIELLGYAKNNIAEVCEKVELSDEFKEKIHRAYILLDEIQEYLWQIS